MATERAEAQPAGPETTPPVLGDLIPLAAVIGAGCEPCAQRMVWRALQHEGARPLVERTLAILAAVSAAECFADAVGPEAIDRMNRSLRAGRKALDRPRPVRSAGCG
jgi:hypothetical protein